MHFIVLAVGFFLIYAFLADRNENKKLRGRKKDPPTQAQLYYRDWRKATKHIGREDWYAYRKAKKKVVKGWN